MFNPLKTSYMSLTQEVDFDTLRLSLVEDYNNVIEKLNNVYFTGAEYKLSVVDFNAMTNSIESIGNSIAFLVSLTAQTTQINDIYDKVKPFKQLDI